MATEREVEQQFDREVGQDRFTRLDRDLIMKIGEDDAVDMRPSNTTISHGDQHYRLLKRLKKLEQLGLAWEIEPGRWNLSAGIDDTLKELGERGDIIKTMHRALAEQRLERGTGDYAIHRSYDQDQVVIGRVISKGFALVPWRPVIEHELGRNISGIMQGDNISWELGRSRDLGIGL
jgi:type IV secretory pathway VirD2 relaxase